MQHADEEYGGPFKVEVSPEATVADLSLLIQVCLSIRRHKETAVVLASYVFVPLTSSPFLSGSGKSQDKSGIPPGIQRLAYAGKNLDDPDRKLKKFGIIYWHSKFPDWCERPAECVLFLARSPPVGGIKIDPRASLLNPFLPGSAGQLSLDAFYENGRRAAAPGERATLLHHQHSVFSVVKSDVCAVFKSRKREKRSTLKAEGE